MCCAPLAWIGAPADSEHQHFACTEQQRNLDALHQAAGQTPATLSLMNSRGCRAPMFGLGQTSLTLTSSMSARAAACIEGRPASQQVLAVPAQCQLLAASGASAHCHEAESRAFLGSYDKAACRTLWLWLRLSLLQCASTGRHASGRWSAVRMCPHLLLIPMKEHALPMLTTTASSVHLPLAEWGGQAATAEI